jgi:hypothetical protein
VQRTATFEDPLRSINNFKDNYNFPDKATRQSFEWGPMGCEWTVRMAPAHGAYGGVVFRRSLDLAVAYRRNRRLIFQMKPFAAASAVTVALTEKNPDEAAITLRRPLSDYEAGTNGDWGYYAIELSEFNTGHPRDRLNWGRVAGVKLVRLETTGETLVTTLRNILFEL